MEQDFAADEVDSCCLVLEEPDLAVARHVAEWVDDVARLDGAHRDRGQEGIELEEILLVDEEGIPVFAAAFDLPIDRATSSPANPPPRIRRRFFCTDREYHGALPPTGLGSYLQAP